MGDHPYAIPVGLVSTRSTHLAQLAWLAAVWLVGLCVTSALRLLARVRGPGAGCWHHPPRARIAKENSPQDSTRRPARMKSAR